MTPAQIAECTAIKLMNIPDEYNNREFLKQRFGMFGPRKVICRPRIHSATLVFADHQSAVKAKTAGTVIKPGDSPVKIVWVSPSLANFGQSEIDQEIAAADGPRIPTRPQRPPTSRMKSPKSEEVPKIVEKTVEVDLRQIAAQLRTLIGRHCPTVDEKCKLLEERDKIIRKARPKVGGVGLGTCPDMCPERERYLREMRKQVWLMNF